MKIMKIIEERERYEKEVEIQANTWFWLERVSLTSLVVVFDFISDLISPLFISTTLLIIFFFFFSSDGPSDRFVFLWGLTVFMTIVNKIVSYADKIHHVVSLLHPDLKGIDDDVGDVSKELEKMKELLKELREDEKKMDIEMEFIEHIINTNLETHRKNVKLLELREELKDDGEKMRTYMKIFFNSELVTVREDLGINVDEIWEDLGVDEDIKASIVGDEVHESYLVIKAAKITADRANLTYLVTQEIIDEIQNMTCMRKDEDHEGFVELREEVRRMLLDSEARRMEAETMAERAAEELSRAMVELAEMFKIRQWEDYKTD